MRVPQAAIVAITLDVLETMGYDRVETWKYSERKKKMNGR